MELPVVAGAVSTVMFAASTLPMVLKAARTKDLRSYSPANIVLSNMANLVHTVYVLHLPAGPIWLLHGFYLVTTALMLAWYLRYVLVPGRAGTHPTPGTYPPEVDVAADAARTWATPTTGG